MAALAVSPCLVPYSHPAAFPAAFRRAHPRLHAALEAVLLLRDENGGESRREKGTLLTTSPSSRPALAPISPRVSVTIVICDLVVV